MKIAVSAAAPSLDADVDPRFGRCQYFIIVDPKTMQFETLKNPNIAASGGAGISTAQMIASKGAETVLTGNCGPNAYQTLLAAGIQVITGVSGRLKGVVEAYKMGKLQPSAQLSVGSHHGMGVGCGMGRRMGRGMGGNMGMRSEIIPQAISPEQEIEMLKNQAQMMAQQLKEIQRRIAELEKER